jgi:hypothetical protein
MTTNTHSGFKELTFLSPFPVGRPLESRVGEREKRSLLFICSVKE